MLTPSRHGFTLIELSIVLVIIGLVIGGVLVGRDLIKASEIRAQITQIEEVKVAVNTFRVKYGFLPGDMPPTQASQLGFFTFTGVLAGQGCVSGSVAFGNNDGIINGYDEAFPAWSHLSDSKLIKGNYAGTSGNLLISAAPNCLAQDAGTPIAGWPTDYESLALFQPRSKLVPEKGFLSLDGNNYTAPNNAVWHLNLSINKKRNTLLYIYDAINFDNIFSSYQLHQIDSKIDDGLPASGSVIMFEFDRAPCSTSGVTPIRYDLSSSTANSPVCWGAFFAF